MNWFTATTSSQADVAADRDAVWDVLTDPDALAELTPLLRRIDVDGDLWRWCFTQVPLLGLAVTPAFTERMRFSRAGADRLRARPAGGVARTVRRGGLVHPRRRGRRHPPRGVDDGARAAAAGEGGRPGRHPGHGLRARPHRRRLLQATSSAGSAPPDTIGRHTFGGL